MGIQQDRTDQVLSSISWYMKITSAAYAYISKYVAQDSSWKVQAQCCLIWLAQFSVCVYF